LSPSQLAKNNTVENKKTSFTNVTREKQDFHFPSDEFHEQEARNTKSGERSADSGDSGEAETGE
jgi:hypothetical protein